MLIGSCKYENGTPKVARNPLILGRSGTQYVTMVTKLLSSNCGAHLVESYCNESNICDTNWLRYLFSSHFIKMLLGVWRHHEHEYLWNKKRYLKMASIEKMRLSCLFCGKFTKFDSNNLLIVTTKIFKKICFSFPHWVSFNLLVYVRRFRKSLPQSQAVRTCVSIIINRCLINWPVL